MELVLKIPKGKPPFIGVLFHTKEQACSKNSVFLPDNESFEHELVMDPSQRLSITLFYRFGFSEKYEVDYNPVTLLKFLHHTKDCASFTFGHLYMASGKMTVAKTNGKEKPLLFKIKSIKVQILVIEQ